MSRLLILQPWIRRIKYSQISWVSSTMLCRIGNCSQKARNLKKLREKWATRLTMDQTLKYKQRMIKFNNHLKQQTLKETSIIKILKFMTKDNRNKGRSRTEETKKNDRDKKLIGNSSWGGTSNTKRRIKEEGKSRRECRPTEKNKLKLKSREGRSSRHKEIGCYSNGRGKERLRNKERSNNREKWIR